MRASPFCTGVPMRRRGGQVLCAGVNSSLAWALRQVVGDASVLPDPGITWLTIPGEGVAGTGVAPCGLLRYTTGTE